MRRKEVLREHSQWRTSSRKNTPRKYKVIGNCSNINVIDLDSDNVIIIDGNECLCRLHPNFHCPSVLREGRKFSYESIIDINDDESNVEDHVKGCGELDSDATSSKTSFPAFNYMENNVQSREKKSSFHFSNCKETYYAQATSTNRYGLGPEFDYNLSESDWSDCEIVEDSFGMLREQWEKASLKRKHVSSHQSGLEGHSSTSGSNSEINTNAEEKKGTEQHTKRPTFSSSSNAHGCMEDHPLRPQKGNFSGECGQKVELGSSSYVEPWVVDETDYLYQDTDFEPCGGTVAEDPFINFELQSPTETGANIDAPHFFNSEELFPEGFSSVDVNNDHNLRFKEGSNFFDSQPSFSNCDNRNTSVEEEDTSSQRKLHGHHERVVMREKDDKTLSSFDILSPNEYEEKTSEEAYDNTSEVSSEKACYQDKIRKDFDEVYLGASLSREKQACLKKSCSEGGKKPYKSRDLSHPQGGDATPSVERDIISGREKLKETAEYKRVIEEEWASRQLELQIQAEEAKRLHKRKKAENMRILDMLNIGSKNMQRRQLHRVEEVRETQKKDEENMNLKEKLRAEVRNELNRLEITCVDMASLLRRLGIQVGGGASPMSHEINAAYKRALLKFHPDRASRTDIRLQVEAEEKFKLIFRMKEEFL